MPKGFYYSLGFRDGYLWKDKQYPKNKQYILGYKNGKKAKTSAMKEAYVTCKDIEKQNQEINREIHPRTMEIKKPS